MDINGLTSIGSAFQSLGTMTLWSYKLEMGTARSNCFNPENLDQTYRVLRNILLILSVSNTKKMTCKMFKKPVQCQIISGVFLLFFYAHYSKSLAKGIQTSWRHERGFRYRRNTESCRWW